MKSRNWLLILALIIVIANVLFISSVQALPHAVVTRREAKVAFGSVWYTQTSIILGGALDVIKIPDNWNGKLFMLCRGYAASPESGAPIANQFDPNAIPMDLFVGLLVKGFATAASNYGEGGAIVDKGMIHTHQLTEYVLDNYPVTGNVYLMGNSMGGNTVLQLGAKYPELYSGVLDIAGPKNMITQYNSKIAYANIATDADLAAAIIANGGKVPPYPQPSIAAFRVFCEYSACDIALACGGTPEEKVKAYEKISPVYSASDLSIPTITIHGTSDTVVPYSSSVEFMNAVAANDDLNLYRLYKVIGAQHGDTLLTSQISNRVDQLVNWVENGILPPPSSV